MAERINPIPDCQLTWVFGLLETLEDRGGRDDGYRIARDLQFNFSDLLKVMKAAEILGFVSTPSGDVVLEALGKQFLELDVNQRKLLLREQLKKLSLFAYFIRLLRGQPDLSLPKEIALEHLAMLHLRIYLLFPSRQSDLRPQCRQGAQEDRKEPRQGESGQV